MKAHFLYLGIWRGLIKRFPKCHFFLTCQSSFQMSGSKWPMPRQAFSGGNDITGSRRVFPLLRTLTENGVCTCFQFEGRFALLSFVQLSTTYIALTPLSTGYANAMFRITSFCVAHACDWYQRTNIEPDCCRIDLPRAYIEFQIEEVVLNLPPPPKKIKINKI